MNVTTIVFINGLCTTARIWENWVKHYTGKGYRVVAPNWPGMEGETERLRRDSSRFASLGVADVVGRYEKIMSKLDPPPIIIGHGFGGLVTQILLDRGWGAAGVAIATAPVRGVGCLPLSTLKVLLAALGNPFRIRQTTSLTPKQFHRAFTNRLSEAESLAAYLRYVVPGPKRVLWQAAMACFDSKAATAVNFHNDTRAPLLLVAGGKDLVAPPELARANFDLYRESNAETDYKEFYSRAHFMLGEKNWEEIADYVLGWALCRAKSVSQPRVVSHGSSSWSLQFFSV